MKDNITSYEYVIKNNQGLVYHIVKRFPTNPFDRDDLVQAGMMGLLDAARKFNMEKGVAFSSFAVPYILGSIKKELAKQNAIKLDYRTRKIIDKLKNGDKPLEKIAEEENTSIENVIIASSFMEKVHYLKEEEIDNIADNSWYNMINASELDQTERKILKMRLINNMTQKEIAQVLAINQSSVCRKLKTIANKVLI